ncbi:collagen-binding protein [Cytophagales bacterium WSM2-2]|nr:collagen-binding protein [Cytophagales bacterium WSM2-2]
MKKFIFLCFVLAASAVSAQKFVVKGQLKDSVGALPGATIMILQQKDSSLVQFGVSNSEGKFEVKGISAGDYIFKASFTSYQSYMKKFSARPENGQEIDLGAIRMSPKSNTLNEVVVKGFKDPVKVKRDTVEYNAGSFKVKPNANVEDLLKKLPGVEVDNSGTITAQGETVQRVMVDGKEFFGQDPKLATRNLPADAVDKVQVYDKKSDQAVFSGIDDGQRQKTVNLELKEEKRHAMFGNNSVGAGKDMIDAGGSGRYMGSVSLNRFEKGNQLSFLGMGNNVNQQGFSFGDVANFGGAAGGGGGGATIVINQGGGGGGGPQANTGLQNGIVTNYAGGVNGNRTSNGGNTKVNASYFYNRMDQSLATTTHRINYLSPNPTLPDGGFYNFDQFSGQHSITDNHRANLTIDHKIDSANSLKFTGNASYSSSDQAATTQATTMNIGNIGVKNDNANTTTSRGNSASLNSSLLLRHRFPKKGRTVSSNLTFNYTSSDSKGTLNSTTNFYNPDSVGIQNQRNSQSTTSPTYGVTLSYTEPLGGRKYLEANYNFTSDINKVNKEVYNADNDILDTKLSNKYNSNYLYNRPGLNFRVNREKYSLTVGAAYQNTRLHGDLILKNVTIDKEFQAFLPVAHFNYDFTNFKRFRFDYTTNMQEPTIQQLQPIIDNSNPLNLSQGNPDLRPAYSHQLRTNFTLFDPTSFMNVFAFVNANYTTNSIVNSQTVDNKTLIRTTMPVNVKDGASVNGTFNFGIPVRKINSRFNLGPNYSASRSINVVNNEENTMVQQTVGGRTGYNYTLGEVLIFDMSANFSYQETKYSYGNKTSSPGAQQSPSQYYFNQTYSSEVNVNFLKKYSFNTELDYFIYNSATTNFHQEIPLLKASISRFILKNNTGEIKFTVNNMLNYGVSVTQTASTNYLQQVTNNNLGRYFMVSFTYALNKQLNPLGGGRRGGGNRMMIRM